MNNKLILTYDKNHALIPSIGEIGVNKLRKAHISLIGLGGLGSPCAISLAGCSIGELVCIDFDTVSASNLHRQTLFSFDDIGEKKTVVAQKRLNAINPSIKIRCHDAQVTVLNIFQFIENADVVIDATDNFETRYVINDACIAANKPLVYGAIHQTEGHVTVFNQHDSATLRSLFPEDAAQNAVLDCNILGAYNITTQVIGNFMANEAVKIILGDADVLRNKLLTFNALTYDTQIFGFSENSSARQESLKRVKTGKIESFSIQNDAELQNLLAQNAILIDVRSASEHGEKNIGGINLPVSENYFETHRAFFSKVNTKTPLIVYCQTGARSTFVQRAVQNHGFRVYNLFGGLNNFLR